MKEFSSSYNFLEIEQKWQKWWCLNEIYSWDESQCREDTFVVDTPPPTVSGQLHIGHVYSYTNVDFIVRFQRMMGKNIYYPMGFDDNGLPTERLVEKLENVRINNLGRDEFIKICEKVIALEEQKFKNLFNQVALSVDWKLEYQTISPLSRKLSQLSFLDLVSKGEVYKDQQPILWDTVDQTALSQADIEDKPKQSHMNDIAFKSENGEQLIVATTRPELLAACVALFYNPNDLRYQHLKGQFGYSPLYNIKVPIFADELVDIDKGTGLVMCCTFGDTTDILWWRKHNLESKIIINKQGYIDIDPKLDITGINGLKIKEARLKIIDILKDQGLLIKQVEINHNVKCAERSGAPIEILTNTQWFICALAHKEALLEQISNLNWHPKSMQIKLETWIKNLSWDWCISRQRYFGIPFPVWYSKRQGEEGRILFANPSKLPVDPSKDLPDGYEPHEVEPELDVMDTWATSSISPQLSSHAITEEFAVDLKRHQKLFPADLRPQAHEIIRTWAFYTILKSYLHQGSLPWKNIMISGWCLAEDRSKMSKSKGNSLNPEKLLNEFGADVIRYWSANSKLGADTTFSPEVIKSGKRLTNKLLNASKFVNLHFNILSISDKIFSKDLIDNSVYCLVDQWLLVKLSNTVAKVTCFLQNFEYSDALDEIEQFFWKDFCDNYLEIVKVRIYNQQNVSIDGQYSAVMTLYYSLKTLLKLFAPFMPYITEEIYNIMYASDESIHSRGNWPNEMLYLDFKGDFQQTEDMVEILNLVRKAKSDRNLSIKTAISLIEIKSQPFNDNLIIDLKNVTSALEIKFVNEFSEISHLITSDKTSINIFY